MLSSSRVAAHLLRETARLPLFALLAALTACGSETTASTPLPAGGNAGAGGGPAPEETAGAAGKLGAGAAGKGGAGAAGKGGAGAAGKSGAGAAGKSGAAGTGGASGTAGAAGGGAGGASGKAGQAGAGGGSGGQAGTSSTQLTDDPCTFDGFCWENPAPNGVSLEDVWGASDDDLWAVGYSGALRHFDGKSWTFHAPLTRETLHGVHGRSESDVWAVGDRGVLLHFDGVSWSAVSSPTTERLDAVYVLPDGEAWAVGREAPVLHFVNGVWNKTDGPASGERFSGVQAFAKDDVWLANGRSGNHWNGTKWERHTIDDGNNVALAAFEKTSGGDLYAYVENGQSPWRPLYKWNGAAFAQVVFPADVEPAAWGNYGTIGAGASDDVWIVSEVGIVRFDGSAWSVSKKAKIGHARGIFFSPSGKVVGVGDEGLVVGRAPGDPLDVVHEGSKPHTSYAAIGLAKDADTEWVAGSASVVRRSPDASSWALLPPPPVPILGITSLTARSNTSVWFTTTNASSASLFEWNGTTYVDHTGPASSFWMNAAHTTADGVSYFAGDKQAVRFTGTTLEPVSVPQGSWINALCSNAPDDIWAVGNDGAILRKGAQGGFLAVASPASADLRSVHCVSANEVWITGYESTLLRWDGTSFQTVKLAPLRPGLETYTSVVGVAGAIDGPHGLWVLIGGGEVFELHGTDAPILHQLHLDANALAFTRPNELVVVGRGSGVMRKTF